MIQLKKANFHPLRFLGRPAVLAAITGILGTAISVSLWHARLSTENRIAQDEFVIEAQNLKRGVVEEIRLFTDVLDSIRHLHNISDRISSEDFNEFVSKGMLHQMKILGAFGFAQVIDHQTRLSLEGAEDVSMTLQVLEPGSNGSFRSRSDQPEYFPLTYQTPESGLGIPVGFDLKSFPTGENAIARMTASGQMVLCGPVQDGSGKEFLFVFAPIVYREERSAATGQSDRLVGFAVALLQPEHIMMRAAQRSSHRNITLVFGPTDAPPPSPVLRRAEDGTLSREETVMVADQPWLLACQAGTAYLAAKRSSQPLILLLSGLLVTALLTLQLILLAGRTRRVEQLVRERTRDLREATLRIEQEMTERLRLESEITEIGTREKQRVGQDLHDSLGQKLTAGVFLSKALAVKLAESNSEDAAGAKRINELLKDAVAQVRRLARGLAPVELGDEGLADALHRLAEDAEESYGVVCRFRPEGDARVSDGKTALHLYHIAQEAVNNATRHGKATEIEIVLSTDVDGGKLTVEDNGTGLPANSTRSGGMGLQVMKYRASIIQGGLTILPRDGGGTVLTCRFERRQIGAIHE